MLTIFLLDRNYALTSDMLAALLTFRSDDPALATLQRDVLAFASAQDLTPAPQREPTRAPGRSRWLRWLGTP